MLLKIHVGNFQNPEGIIPYMQEAMPNQIQTKTRVNIPKNTTALNNEA